MESIRRRDLQARISVAPGREEKEHDQASEQVHRVHGFLCGGYAGSRSGDRGVHEEPFVRCGGCRDHCLRALYMNNSTYVCLIRRGTMGCFRERGHTLMYVYVNGGVGMSDCGGWRGIVIRER